MEQLGIPALVLVFMDIEMAHGAFWGKKMAYADIPMYAGGNPNFDESGGSRTMLPSTGFSGVSGWNGSAAPAPAAAPASAMTPEQNANIASFFFANTSNPGAIADAMKTYGVSAADLSNAVAGQNGVSANDVQNYVARIGTQTGNGAGFGGNTSSQQQRYTDWNSEAQAREQQRQQLLAGVSGGGGGGSAGTTNQQQMNLGMGSGQSNPYIGAYGNAITNQVTQNLQRNILPNISSSAMAAGGFGGSRQGVVEANALNDANQGLSNALAGAYSQDWNNQQGRNLQQYGMDQSYNLGLGNLGLNAQNSQNNFYTAQRGQDLQAAGLGAQLSQMANQGYLNQGSGMYDVGTQYQNAPWNTMNQFNQAATPYTGYGATSTVSQNSNPWAQALGGAIGGAQLGRLF